MTRPRSVAAVAAGVGGLVAALSVATGDALVIALAAGVLFAAAVYTLTAAVTTWKARR